jgi:enoyl-CoA hydratase/carnithine racemase
MPKNDANILDIRRNGGFQTLRMTFAPANAFDPCLLSALRRALDQAVNDENIAAIVLTSGLRIFSAGGDAKWMGQQLAARGPQGLVDEFNQIMNQFRELCLEIRRCPLLVIAALNGHTLGGGLELAAACDMRFVADAEGLQIGAPEMDLFGVMPSGGGGTQFITRLMGPSRALNFIFNARPVNPSQAYAIGLVDRLCDPAKLLSDAETFAAEVANKAGRIGVAACKRAVFEGVEMPIAQALEFDRSLHWDAMRRGNFPKRADDFARRFGARQ